MPELPEVAVSARIAATALTGRVIREVVIKPCKLFRPPRSHVLDRSLNSDHTLISDPEELQSALTGARGALPSFLRVGKLMAHGLTTREGKALTLFARLGMTGKYVSAPIYSEARQGAKLTLLLSEDKSLTPSRKLEHINTRMFGQIWAKCSDVLTSDEDRKTAHHLHFSQELEASRLGPDALELAEQPQQWINRLRDQAQKRRIKVTLLDQSVIAGIGNIYAAEGIFCASVHPLAFVKDLSDEALLLIAQGVREAMWSTLQRSSEGDEVIYGTGRGVDSPFKVYGREGLECIQCQTILTKLMIGGRGTVICPSCQK